MVVVSNMESDENSIMALNPIHEFLEARKQSAIIMLSLLMAATMALSKQQVKILCAGRTIHSAARCKASFIGHIKRLKKRLEKTTNAKYGAAAFEEDIMQLLLNVEDVFCRDLHGSVDIRFRKYVPRICVPKVCS